MKVHGAQLVLPQAPRWAGVLLGSTLVFNILDAALTTAVLKLGLAVEANPIMAAAWDQGPVVFNVVKIGTVSLGAWILWRNRQRKLALAGIALVFAVYTMVMLYQLESVRLLASLAQR